MRRRNKGNALALIILLGLLYINIYWRQFLVGAIIILLLFIIYKLVKAYIKQDIKEKNEINAIYNRHRYNNLKPTHYTTYTKDKYYQKGLEAEEKIIRILSRIFNKENIIHDSYFVDKELVTTQVDIVVVALSGIYVIESKAYSGVIKGSGKNKQWVQLFANKKYNRFSNPIMQNERHIKDIKENLKEYNLPEEAFKSYIVFSDECKLDIEECEDVSVIKQRDLFYTILADHNSSKNFLSAEQVERISSRIRAHANVDDELKISHIERRKNNVKY